MGENEAVGSGPEQPVTRPRSKLGVMLAIMAAGMVMIGCGLLGTVLFLQRSFAVVGVEMNPEEKAASLSSNIKAAMVSNVLVLLGMAVSALGPVVYWLFTRKRTSETANEHHDHRS